jgi:hypothetical protein
MAEPQGEPTAPSKHARRAATIALVAALALACIVAARSPARQADVAAPRLVADLAPADVPVQASEAELPSPEAASPASSPNADSAPPPLPPLPVVVVTKRPEPKKPRDILFPGEVMKPERPIAAQPVVVPPTKQPAKVVSRPPSAATPVAPGAVNTTRTKPKSGTMAGGGIRLGPCGPLETRYMRDGVEVDAFGRPCD